MTASDPQHYDRRRQNGEQLHRMWSMAEHIIGSPGQMRKEIPVTYGVSQRQVQADLNLLRGVGLIRRSDYSFEVSASSALPFSMAEAATLLILVLERYGNTPECRDDAWAKRKHSWAPALAAKLAARMPPHLQPFAAAVLQHRIPLELVKALAKGETIRVRDVRLQPELLVPYGRHWWVVGVDVDNTDRHVAVKVEDVDPE